MLQTFRVLLANAQFRQNLAHIARIFNAEMDRIESKIVQAVGFEKIGLHRYSTRHLLENAQLCESRLNRELSLLNAWAERLSRINDFPDESETMFAETRRKLAQRLMRLEDSIENRGSDLGDLAEAFLYWIRIIREAIGAISSYAR